MCLTIDSFKFRKVNVSNSRNKHFKLYQKVNPITYSVMYINLKIPSQQPAGCKSNVLFLVLQTSNPVIFYIPISKMNNDNKKKKIKNGLEKNLCFRFVFY